MLCRLNLRREGIEAWRSKSFWKRKTRNWYNSKKWLQICSFEWLIWSEIAEAAESKTNIQRIFLPLTADTGFNGVSPTKRRKRESSEKIAFKRNFTSRRRRKRKPPNKVSASIAPFYFTLFFSIDAVSRRIFNLSILVLSHAAFGRTRKAFQVS